MTKKQLFHETFSCLHASDTIYEEVLEMTRIPKKRKLHLIPKKAVILCTLAILTSSITALAVRQNDFFQSIFGPKGQTNISAHKLKEKSEK